MGRDSAQWVHTRIRHQWRVTPPKVRAGVLSHASDGAARLSSPKSSPYQPASPYSPTKDHLVAATRLVLCKNMCDSSHMATNVQIDPDLIRDALLLGGKRTKREVIEEALQEYVLRRKQQQLLSLFGTLDYDPGYDYKKQRARR